jgi:hypothetical protein
MVSILAGNYRRRIVEGAADLAEIPAGPFGKKQGPSPHRATMRPRQGVVKTLHGA